MRPVSLTFVRALCATAIIMASSPAHATYWNLFNLEGESSQSARYDTYATLTDMLNDINRTGSFAPDGFGSGKNIIGTGSDGTTYWNLFNLEGESTQSARFDTYATLADMLGDTNRTGSFAPDGFGSGKNIIGAGSDGKTYWNLFNLEGESTQSARYDTYATLNDMLNDTNRTGSFAPDGFGSGKNIVGTGSNGTSYWNLFNLEGESTQSARYDTYATLNDMLNDTNRTGSFAPDGFGSGKNIVDGGSDSFPAVSGSVPEPESWVMLTTGLMLTGFVLRRRRRRSALM